jgi:hypothetical protein
MSHALFYDIFLSTELMPCVCVSTTLGMPILKPTKRQIPPSVLLMNQVTQSYTFKFITKPSDIHSNTNLIESRIHELFIYITSTYSQQLPCDYFNANNPQDVCSVKLIAHWNNDPNLIREPTCDNRCIWTRAQSIPHFVRLLHHKTRFSGRPILNAFQQYALTSTTVWLATTILHRRVSE